MRDPNFYDYGKEDWSGYATRSAIKPFAETLLKYVDDYTKTNAEKRILDGKVYYKVTGEPTKIMGITIRSVLYNEDFTEITVGGHTYTYAEEVNEDV